MSLQGLRGVAPEALLRVADGAHEPPPIPFRAQARNLLFRELPGWPSPLAPLPILGEGKEQQRTNSVTLSLSKGSGAFRPLPLESGEGLGKGACRPLPSPPPQSQQAHHPAAEGGERRGLGDGHKGLAVAHILPVGIVGACWQ